MTQYGVWKDNILYNARSPGQVMRQYDEGITTVHEAIDKAFTNFADRPAAGYRKKTETLMVPDPKSGKSFEKFKFEDEFTWLKYGQWGKRVSDFGKGLVDFTGAKSQDRVLIYAETQMDWMTAAIAGWRHSLEVVTCYATLGADGAAYAINSTKSAVVVADAKLLKELLKVHEQCPCMKYIITVESCDKLIAETRDKLKNDGVQVVSMDELITKGAASASADSRPPKPQDIAVIMFTSGTTGLPKGVLISHRNLVAAISGLHPSFKSVSPPVNSNDRYIAYLPLAHIMEIVAELTNLSFGVSMGYGSPHTLTDTGVKLAEGQKGDLSILSPTVVVFAPLVLEKIYGAITMKFDALTGVKAKLRDWGLANGKANFKSGGVGASWIYDKLLFSKVQKLTGGAIRLCITGSAPLDGNVHQFIQTCLACPVRQGYGSTETCAASFLQHPAQNEVCNVGPPVESCCLRLADWEEGGYRRSDANDPAIGMPRGEILLGGGVITNGYLVDEANPDPELVKKNQEEFTEEGGIRWFHTGDIGCVHKDGTLSIIDRKKDLVKLQNGEYVALSKVEGVVKLSQLVDNAMVHVDPSQPYCTVLVCPNLPALKHWAKENGLGEDLDAACSNPALAKEVLKQINQEAGGGKLARFEIPTKCHVVKPDQIWTPENELLTAAQKLKRKPIIDAHKKDIAKMYA